MPSPGFINNGICVHEPSEEICLVGVIGEDRPHCIKCRHCGEMVPWEQWSEPDKFRYRFLYAFRPVSQVDIEAAREPGFCLSALQKK